VPLGARRAKLDLYEYYGPHCRPTSSRRCGIWPSDVFAVAGAVRDMDVSVSPAAVRWAALRVVAKHRAAQHCAQCRPDGSCDMYRWAAEELRSDDNVQ